MFKCDILHSIFRAVRGRNAEKRSSGMLQNFGFDFPSRQFIFNALS